MIDTIISHNFIINVVTKKYQRRKMNDVFFINENIYINNCIIF